MFRAVKVGEIKNRVGEHGGVQLTLIHGGIYILVPAVPVNERSENIVLNPKRRDFWDREIGTYHATDTGKCLRQVYYEFELGRRERREAYPHFHLGNLTEGYIEGALAHHYGRDNIKNSFRVKLEFDDFRIVGQTDPVLIGPNAQPVKLFEVKSTKWLEPRREGPSEHHVYQVHPYMRALDLDSCTLIYVQKTDLDIVSHRISFDKPTFQRGIKRIQRLHDVLTDNEAPDPVPFSDWECQYCPYKEECPREGD